MDPRRSSRWACAHHRRYPWRFRLACAAAMAGVDQRSFKTAFGQLYSRAVGHPQLGTPECIEHPQPRVVTTAASAGELEVRGSESISRAPMPPRKLKPEPGQRSLAGATPRAPARGPSSWPPPPPRISLHVRCVTMLIRLPPPFHSQFSGSRARIRSPRQNRRHRPPWRTMLPRRSRRVVVAPARPASPQPRAPIGNHEEGSRRRVGRWPVHPKRAGAPRSSPARPR